MQNTLSVHKKLPLALFALSLLALSLWAPACGVTPPTVTEEAKTEPVNKTEKTSEPIAEPKPEPAPEPKAEPKAEPKPEPTPEPKAEPKPEPTPEPAPEPTVDASEPLPEGACKPGESQACYTGPNNTEGVGICKQGLQTCQPDRTWGNCEGETLPGAKEICGNKLDDNCDGKTDAEDMGACTCNPGQTQPCYSGPQGTAGTGVCKEGTQTCDSNSTWGACQGEVLPGAKEICGNKLDDNCDGKTDTADAAVCECDPQKTRPCYTGPQGTKNVGACKEGTQTCKADGKWDVCKSDVTPQNETCDGIDEDCDGNVDNVASGQNLCSTGKRCLGGKCVCDATSCPTGCCNASGNCVAAATNSQCGANGVACVNCGQGRVCSGGKCVCNATSCPNGCCDANGQCQTGKSNTACGTGGIACKACPSGQGCDPSSQVCGCGPNTCSTGCCNSLGKCVSSTTQACGVSGKACQACDAKLANVCTNGQCQCGSGPSCKVGQRCNGSKCVCDSTSCPSGCCDGTTCISTPIAAKCGTSGSACTTCDATKADTCTNGNCRCGTSAACTGAAKCVNGKCDCGDPTFSQIKINNTAYAGTAIKVAPGSQVALSLAYSLSRPCSGSCTVQLAIGNATTGYGGESFGCAYSGIPNKCPSSTSGSGNFTFTAPRSPGVYDIRWKQDLLPACVDSTNRFDALDNGGSLSVLAKIQVTQPTCGSLTNSVYNVSINGGGKEATVAPGSTVTVKASYNVARLPSCPACFIEIAAGLVGGANPLGVGCFFIGGGGVCPNPRRGSKTLSFTAPTVKGTYYFRWGAYLEFSCRDALKKLTANPPKRPNTFGVLIVK
ncbi:MAG TPA: hypothetical protein DCE42_18835 [Myxococcales bacterium]|nr:hypothetical protein [Deltaproteobacteria bacterium]HAA56830.1 hypothetical protein [Myxococcales bacterium]